MSMDKIKVHQLQKAILDALHEVEEDFDVTISWGRGTYSQNNLTAKLAINTNGEDGLANSREADDFKRFCYRLGMNADDLGREVRVNGKVMVITGYATRNRKYPITVRDQSTGKNYKVTLETVRAGLSVF